MIPLTAFLIFSFIQFVSVKKLFVLHHFRHGARAPVSVDEKGYDLFGQKWEVPPGELTEVGMRMHYILGYATKLMHEGFLSSTYDPREIYVISTDLNRTIQSALSRLQGLYPPSTGPTLEQEQIPHAVPPLDDISIISEEIQNLGNKSLPEQQTSIPVHVYHNLERRFLLFDSNNCPKVTEVKDNNLKTDEDIEKLRLYFNETYGEKLLKYFNIQDNPDKFADYGTLSVLADQYIAGFYDARNYSSLREAGIDEISFLKDSQKVAYSVIFYHLFGDKKSDITRMSMSPFFRELLTYMKNAADDVINHVDEYGARNYTRPKLVMISGHDSSLGGVQDFLAWSLGYKNATKFNPTYASDIEFTLYSNHSEPADYTHFVVGIKINNIPLRNRTLDDFNSFTNRKLWDDKKIYYYCYNKTEESQISYRLKIAIVCMVGANFLIIIVWSITCCCINNDKLKEEDE